MIEQAMSICHSYPQIVIFLALALGYAIGKIKIKGFSLSSTVGVLLAALALGQIGVVVPALVKDIGFALFTFCIGYKVGPQFFGSLKKDGLKYLWISLVVAFAGLITAIVLGKLFHFDKGTTAGLLAGAMTQSSAIGTADGAIAHLGVSAAQKAVLNTNVAVAYAITYLFGTGGLVLFFRIVPKILGKDMKVEAKNLEKQMMGDSSDLDITKGLFSWANQLGLRVYKAKNDLQGKTVSEVEALFTARIAIDKIERDGKLIDLQQNTIIRNNDIVAILSRRGGFVQAPDLIGPEVEESKATNVVGEILEICILNNNAVGKTLKQIGDNRIAHGIFLRQITRQGHEIPLTQSTVIQKCDIFQVVGDKDAVERAVKQLGYPERPTMITDLITVGIGCVLGTLIGLLAIPIMGIPITLGVGGGVLVSGLFFGWLRSIHPTFGQIPGPAQWIFTDFGLNLFIACVGLTAGAQAVQALKTTGASVFIAGIILSLLPMIIGLIFGMLVIKMNFVLLLGALAGAGTVTPALNSLQEDANSSTPVLGYTAPYAFGNVLLTVWGTILINVM